MSASILVGAHPDAVIVGHRPNHPYREPRGIENEIRAIEALEPTKVIGLSLNLLNANDLTLSDFEEKYNLPAVDMRNGGASILLDVILNYFEENKK